MVIFKCDKQSSITRSPAQQGKRSIFFLTNTYQGTDTKHDPVKRSTLEMLHAALLFCHFSQPFDILGLQFTCLLLDNALQYSHTFFKYSAFKTTILFIRQHPERQKSSLAFVISPNSANSGCSTRAIYLNILLMESVLGCQNPDLYTGSEQKKAEHFSERFSKQIVWKDAVLFLFVHG